MAPEVSTMSVRSYGAKGVRAVLRRQLEAKLPAVLTIMEQQQGLQAGALNKRPIDAESGGLLPRQIVDDVESRLALSEFPAIVIMSDGVTRATPWQPSDHSDPNLPMPNIQDAYLRIYTLIVHGYVMGSSEAQILADRDNLEFAVWQTLNMYAALSTNVVYDNTTWQSGFQDIEMPKERSMASGFSARFQVRAVEGISIPTEGVADTIATDVGLLG